MGFFMDKGRGFVLFTRDGMMMFFFLVGLVVVCVLVGGAAKETNSSNGRKRRDAGADRGVGNAREDVLAGDRVKETRGTDVSSGVLVDDPSHALDDERVVLIVGGQGEAGVELVILVGELGVDDLQTDTDDDTVLELDSGRAEQSVVDVGGVEGG